MRTLFAAQFYGSPVMNVVDAILKGGTATLFNSANLETNSKQTGDVIVGIRPDRVTLDPRGKSELYVMTVDPLGANALLHCKLKGSDKLVAASLSGVDNISKNHKNLRLSILNENMQ